jgi:hypothetical protein
MPYIMWWKRNKQKPATVCGILNLKTLAICLSFMYVYNLNFFAMNFQCLWLDFPIKIIQDCYAKAI